MTIRRFRPLVVTVLLLASASVAVAGPTPQQLCMDAKHKAAGKHASCLARALATAVKRGAVADYAACDSRLTDDVARADTTYGVKCRTSDDSTGIAARDAAMLDAVDAVLDPAGAPEGAAAGCALAKLKAAGKRVTCGAKAKSVQIRKNLRARDIARCDSKLTSDFTKADTKGAGACPAGGSAGAVGAAIDAAFAQLEADLANLGTADFAKRGTYKVGRRTMTFVDTSRGTDANGGFPALPERTLVTEIWYPSNIDGQGVAVERDGAPFPMLIRAHGLGAFRNDSFDLIKQLTSRGFIVVAPDFPLSNINTPGGATLLDLDEQIRDVSYLIDQMLALNATVGGPFENAIDATRIGAIGHSLGGATVLGAGYHPTLRDPRIGAVVADAPFACIYQEAFFDGGSTAALMILGGTADLVTQYTSNQLDVFGRANAEKYLLTLDGGTHVAYADDFLHNDSINPDDQLGCPAVLPFGAPRPYTPDLGVPLDFLGGIAAGVDVTGSTCEPLCPPATATWMTHERQRDISLASATAMFQKVFRGDVSADRLISDRIDSENDDVTLAFER